MRCRIFPSGWTSSGDYGYCKSPENIRINLRIFKTSLVELYPASRGFSLVFLSVVLPFSSRFWLLAFCFGCFSFLGTETTKTKREQPKPRREWQYNAEKHRGKASASRVVELISLFLTRVINQRGNILLLKVRKLLICYFCIQLSKSST